MPIPAFQAALQAFATEVGAKLAQLGDGEPEDQLRAPFETLLRAAGTAFGFGVVSVGEVHHAVGRPDFAANVDGLLCGHSELKAAGKGADTSRYRGRDRQQWERFKAIPNILYTDGNEWALCRSGERTDPIVRLSIDLARPGAHVIGTEDAQRLEDLLRKFLTWEPDVPRNRFGQVDMPAFAKRLAPLCRLMRSDVTDALASPESALRELAGDWRALLFPDASDQQFADAYAQTVTFALLLARSEGAPPRDLDGAVTALSAHHGLLSRALRVLTDGVAAEINTSLSLLLRLIGAIDQTALTGPNDPWLYFYEDFLAEYDPELRRDAGAYYTPVEVVHAQVRMVDDLLTNRLNRPLGFADPGVVTVDPAVGTGTYLLGVIEHALTRITEREGAGAVAGRATELARNLYGLEIMVGPYAVSELRVSRALEERGARLPEDGTRIYLADTLESPNAQQQQTAMFVRMLADHHQRAIRLKREVSVIVCLGNPPYDRHAAVDPAAEAENRLSAFGGWVRFGDPLAETGLRSARSRLAAREQLSILQDFVRPVIAAGNGGDLKNLYNLYIYFWRWALWKVFEHDTSLGPGVDSFISASSYIDGDAFAGMREHLRRVSDEVWIVDLGGEQRGTRRSENVFAIKTPVAIAIAVRTGAINEHTPARVHYARVEGTRDEKLAVLDAITGLESLEWDDCPDEWHAPFRPAGESIYDGWPILQDLMPWQHSGAQFKRTWPIAPDEQTLQRRWRALLQANERAVAFKESRDRTIATQYPGLPPHIEPLPSILELPGDTGVLRIERYGFRSFDRQWILADNRLGDFLRPSLWLTQSPNQIYLTSLFTNPLDLGPAVTATALIPDLHHFRGSFGAKDAFPLYRTADTTEPNLMPGLLQLLTHAYGRGVDAEDFVAYVYGVLAHSGFTERYHQELESRKLRVPLTRDPALFERARMLGAQLLWFHTYGERMVPAGQLQGHLPQGRARNTVAVPQDEEHYPDSFEYDENRQAVVLRDVLGQPAGAFSPVSRDVFEFSVSGFGVVRSWLNSRMREGSGRSSSPLDNVRPLVWTQQFTTEFLELLWVLEATLAQYPEQANLLELIEAGPCFTAAELPAVPDEMRSPPARPERGHRPLFDG